MDIKWIFLQLNGDKMSPTVYLDLSIIATICYTCDTIIILIG